MTELMVRARGRGEWDDWKLGDSIIVCSALAHIADDITLYVRNPNANGIKLIQALSEQVYSDKYKLTVKKGTGGEVIYPDQYMLDNNVDVIRYNHSLPAKDYVVIQPTSKDRTRSVKLTDKLKDKYIQSNEVVDFDKAAVEYKNQFKKIFDMVSQAKRVVCCVSGFSLVSASCQKECIVLANNGWLKARRSGGAKFEKDFAFMIADNDVNTQVVGV